MQDFLSTFLQVAEGGWVEGERGERTPFEASLLSSLDHPGRVSDKWTV